MKVLSVRQPWAWAIIFGGKDIENRYWKTKYRGPLVIHASANRNKQYFEWSKEDMEIFHCVSKIPAFEEYDRGMIIGTVDLIDCVTETDSVWYQGKIIGGKENFGWVLANPCPVKPVPFKGMLGLRDYKGKLVALDKPRSRDSDVM